ncbi:hypothetical protein [Alkaliphilus oremlandii]|uniref:hypothetical protein n=1 Tax=Alkaliphilus oremlandii TaxID=461876 RepID=UPI000302B2DF|nr:hypothetical protein [Alkaliphilus oremlandii]
MTEKNKHTNPIDLINETYDAEKFPIIEKTMNALVMPLDMIQDVDSLAYRRFYEDEWASLTNPINPDSIQ